MRVYNINITATEYTNTRIVLKGLNQTNFLGLLPIRVVTGGGMSNVVYIMMW